MQIISWTKPVEDSGYLYWPWFKILTTSNLCNKVQNWAKISFDFLVHHDLQNPSHLPGHGIVVILLYHIYAIRARYNSQNRWPLKKSWFVLSDLLNVSILPIIPSLLYALWPRTHLLKKSRPFIQTGPLLKSDVYNAACTHNKKKNLSFRL